MKNYIFVTILFLVLLSCDKKDKSYDEVIKQNNAFLQDEINIYNARLLVKSREQPNLFDSITSKKINNLSNEVSGLKNYSDYKLIYSKMKKLVIDQKLNIKSNSIISTEKNILKNNLLLYLVNINKMFYYEKSNVIYDISFQPYIKNTLKNDTLTLDFFYHNPYVIISDSIIDGKDKILNLKSKNESNIWQVKYKQNSNESTYYGKIFEVDTDGNTKLVKNIKHKVTK